MCTVIIGCYIIYLMFLSGHSLSLTLPPSGCYVELQVGKSPDLEILSLATDYIWLWSD